MKYIAGIDVGTTGTKTYIFNEDGQIVGKGYKSYELITPEVGLSEQRAEDWWDGLVASMRDAISEAGDIGKSIVAISLSTQGGTMVPVNINMEPLCNAVVWNDRRCEAQREEFLTEIGNEELMYRITGWKLGVGLPVLQIRWLKDNRPEIFKRSKMFLTVPDYLSYKLTGRTAVDMSNVGISRLGNIVEGKCDQRLLEFCGISKDRISEFVSTGDVIGRILADVAELMGISEKCILVAGAHDQYAVALGCGASDKGDMVIGSGTCWVITSLSDKPDFESNIPQSVTAVKGMWGSCWSLSTGGVCLDWIRKKLLSTNEEMSYDRIAQGIKNRNAAASGLFFYPFSGFKSDGKPYGKATFVGLDLSHDCFDIIRAVMEGVCFEIKEMITHFSSQPDKNGVILTGGAVKSDEWTQILSDILDMPVRIPEVADQACVGAAIIAGTSAGVYTSYDAALKKISSKTFIVNPIPKNVEIYSVAFKKYRKYREALDEIYG